MNPAVTGRVHVGVSKSMLHCSRCRGVWSPGFEGKRNPCSDPPCPIPCHEWADELALIESNGKARPPHVDIICVLTRSTETKTRVARTRKRSSALTLLQDVQPLPDKIEIDDQTHATMLEDPWIRT